MTRPYRRLTTEEQTAYGAADWSDPWPTAKTLGARFDRDPKVVLIWAQHRGLAPRGRKRLVTPEDVQAIREGVAAGLLGPSIARTLGLSAETVRRVMVREGIARVLEQAHAWAPGPFGGIVCERCSTREGWPGASQPCVKAGA